MFQLANCKSLPEGNPKYLPIQAPRLSLTCAESGCGCRYGAPLRWHPRRARGISPSRACGQCCGRPADDGASKNGLAKQTGEFTLW
jgi:hypothetical protein